MKTFSELTRNLKQDASEFREVRVAILADSAVQLYGMALRGAAFDRCLDLVVLENDYDQIDRAAFDRSSLLNDFGPDFVIVWHSTQKMMTTFQSLPQDERTPFAERHVAHVRRLVEALGERLPLRIIYFNVPESDDGVFGSFANKVPWSWIYQVRTLNLLLMEFASSHQNFFVCDLNLLIADCGRTNAYDRRFEAMGSLMLSVDFLPTVASRTLDIIDASLGRFRKCLVLDLDNTIWGGVVADDGWENIELGQLGLGTVYSELQLWARELKRRGILLAVASKNNERIAREAFEGHPEMILRLDDFAVFGANWESKVDNLRHIQEILGIAFDSMVFLDDSPVERASVRMSLPDVCVPELPSDPVEVMPYLRSQNLFETASLTSEDARRNRYYQDESRRRAIRTSTKTNEDFLASLRMIARVEDFTPFNLPRIAQLTQRSNQFNLRSVRFTQDELKRITQSTRHVRLAVSLSDRIGDYGLVSVVIMELEGEAMFVNTWLMSCRALRRGLEDFVLGVMVEAAREREVPTLIGEYVPTPKNAIVENHYANQGFEQSRERWYLEVRKHQPKQHFIRRA